MPTAPDPEEVKVLKVIDSIAEKVAEYKNPTINDLMIEIFRILMLRDESGEAFAELYKILNGGGNDIYLNFQLEFLESYGSEQKAIITAW